MESEMDMDDAMRQYLEGMEQRLTERVERSENNLLSAFLRLGQDDGDQGPQPARV